MSVCMCMKVYVYRISYVFLTEGFLLLRRMGSGTQLDALGHEPR